MTHRKLTVVGLLVLLASTSFSCAPAVFRRSEVYEVATPVLFKDLAFMVHSASFAKTFDNWVGQTSTANASFVIVDVSLTNLRGQPLPYHLRPAYKLVDKAGTEYSMSNQHTIMANLGQHGTSLTDEINPGVETRLKLIFDVPQRDYDLQVIVPQVASAGFMGESVRVTGPYFLVRIPYASVAPQPVASPPTEEPARGVVGINFDSAGFVSGVVSSGSAAAAELRVGDRLVRVDGQDVVGASTPVLSALITGEVGTTVSLVVLRGGKELAFDLVRQLPR